MCESRISSVVSLCMAIATGACAEGTKLEVAGSGGSGGATGTTAAAGGRTSSTASGGSVNSARGGAVGVGGTNRSSLPGGGATNSSGTTSSSASGGTVESVGGQVNVGTGGLSAFAGAATSSLGGTPTATTIAPPTSGLGIKITSQVAGNDAVRTTFQLTNQGGPAVDLTSVKIRYYFTMDGWSTPVFVVDNAAIRQGDAYTDCTRSIQSQFYPLAFPNADRYVEMSFSAASNVALSLKADGYLEVQSRLYDQTYKAPNTSNDYSFVGVAGYTDRITVYVGGQLVSGVEPGTSSLGAGGAGGGPSGGAAGAVGNDAGAGGTSMGGSSGASSSAAAGDTAASGAGTTGGTDVQSAGTAGTAGADGFAGGA